MKILGVDPGYDRLGLAVIEKVGSEKLIFSVCVETDSSSPFSERLFALGMQVADTIAKYKPESVAIERAFFNTNQKTAMGVAEARGVVVYEASRADLPVFEYTPGEIKIAVTGYGKGSKEQVISMVERLLNIEKKMKHDDEYDAIAVGLTHLATLQAQRFLARPAG